MIDQTRASERIASIETSAAGRALLPIQAAIVTALRSTNPELHRLVDDIDKATSNRKVQQSWERMLEAAVFSEMNPVSTPSQQIDEMVSARRAIAGEIREIVDRATSANRSLSQSDQDRLELLDGRHDRIAAEEAKLRGVARKLEPHDSKYQRVTANMYQPETETSADPVRAMIKERVITREFAPATSSTTRHLPDLDWNAPAGRLDNWMSFSRDGVMEATRAISDGSNAAALFMNDFSTRVSVYMRTLSPILGAATVIEAADGNGRPVVIPNLTTDSTTYTPGEATAITESSPSIGSVTASPIAYKAMTYVSWEAWEDEQINLSDLVARSHARSIGLAFGSAATTGLLSAINNGGTATGLGGGSTAAFFGLEDLLDLKYGRQAPYRANGKFLMANAAIKKVRKFTDRNGQYLLQSGFPGMPEQFDGSPVLEDPFLSSPASATKSVVYGDFSALIVKMGALRLAVSDSFKFDTDQIAIKSVQRIGLAVPDPSALAFLVSASS